MYNGNEFPASFVLRPLYARTTVPCYTLDIGLNSLHRLNVAAKRKFPTDSWSRTMNIQVNASHTFTVNYNRII